MRIEKDLKNITHLITTTSNLKVKNSMKTKISSKKKAYWKNYFGFWLVFIVACLIMGNIDSYDGGPSGSFSFRTGFIIVSIVSTFILAHLVAKKYSKNEEVDELRVKEGLTYQEFNSKYGKLFEILDK